MLAQVNEIRDKLKQERLEAQSWIYDHNESVRSALTTPDKDENLANSLTDALLAGSNISIGGTERGSNPNTRGKRETKSPQRRRGASRGNRGRTLSKEE